VTISGFFFVALPFQFLWNSARQEVFELRPECFREAAVAFASGTTGSPGVVHEWEPIPYPREVADQAAILDHRFFPIFLPHLVGVKIADRQIGWRKIVLPAGDEIFGKLSVHGVVLFFELKNAVSCGRRSRFTSVSRRGELISSGGDSRDGCIAEGSVQSFEPTFGYP
jgi:hypothetical protein